MQNNFFKKSRCVNEKEFKKKIKEKQERKEVPGILLFSTRQVHLPNAAFGFTSSNCRKTKIVKFVRLYQPNGPQWPPFEAAERPELESLFWTLERGKAREKRYPCRCAPAWAQPWDSPGSGSPFLFPSCEMVPSSSWPSLSPALITW